MTSLWPTSAVALGEEIPLINIVAESTALIDLSLIAQSYIEQSANVASIMSGFGRNSTKLRMLAQFQVTLPLGILFDAATVAEMAALLNTVAGESERREIRELLTDV